MPRPLRPRPRILRSFCTACDDGFVLADNATCEMCSASCSRCFGTPSNCIACHNGSMPVTTMRPTPRRAASSATRAVSSCSRAGLVRRVSGGFFRLNKTASRATRTAQAVRRRRRTASPATGLLHERVLPEMHPHGRRDALPGDDGDGVHGMHRRELSLGWRVLPVPGRLRGVRPVRPVRRLPH